MWKKIIILIALILAVLAVNSNIMVRDNVKKIDFKAEISTMRPWWVPEGVVGWLAVKELDEDLRQAIVTAADIPQDYWAKTRCYYNYVDLNDDGRREALAVLIGPYTSGSGGNMAVLLTEQKEGWQLQQLMTLIHTPVLVGESKTNGYRDLYVVRAGGGTEVEVVQLSYGKDGSYTMVSKAPVVKLSQQMMGTLLMDNDLAKDVVKGEWISLERKQ